MSRRNSVTRSSRSQCALLRTTTEPSPSSGPSKNLSIWAWMAAALCLERPVVEHRSLAVAAARVADQAGAATDEADHAVAAVLESPHRGELQKTADVEAVGGRIEADIDREEIRRRACSPVRARCLDAPARASSGRPKTRPRHAAQFPTPGARDVNPIRAAWPLDHSLALSIVTGPMRVGRGDPTGFVRDGKLWRAARYPTGPAALAVWAGGGIGARRGVGSGRGGRAGRGARARRSRRRPGGFRPVGAPAGGRAGSACGPGLRLGRTGTVFDAAVPAVLGQKVTGLQAKRSYQCTGPARRRSRARWPHVSGRPLLMPPTPTEVLGGARRVTARRRSASTRPARPRCARSRSWRPTSKNLARTASRGASVRAALERIPGIGVWTANRDHAACAGRRRRGLGRRLPPEEHRGLRVDRGSRAAPTRRWSPCSSRFARIGRVRCASSSCSGPRAPRYGPRMDVPSHVPAPRR